MMRPSSTSATISSVSVKPAARRGAAGRSIGLVMGGILVSKGASCSGAGHHAEIGLRAVAATRVVGDGDRDLLRARHRRGRPRLGDAARREVPVGGRGGGGGGAGRKR